MFANLLTLMASGLHMSVLSDANPIPQTSIYSRKYIMQFMRTKCFHWMTDK